MYHLANLGKGFDRVKQYGRRAEKLLGTNLDIEAVWNLIPWSWFIDWNSNLGEIISNAEALSEDGLVLEYGYVMCETEVTRHVHTTSHPTLYGTTEKVPLSWQFSHHEKTRKKANPFGFVLDVGDYNLSHQAILASLGMAKSHTSPF